jgi:F420-dependent oxidoreductase-like protein
MRIGLQITRFNWPGSPDNIGQKLSEIGQAADELGFDSLWVMDHFFQMDLPHIGYKPEEPMLDGYIALSFLAGFTRRIRLGALVTGVIYRHPGHLVKLVTNLDVLSGGRAYFGIGAAWYEREAIGLGFPFPPTKERFERLEETLQIAKQMWSGEVKPYIGKYYRLAEPINNPLPLSKPHPPILIGGGGEKKTLRLVAQYGDACNLFASSGEQTIAHKLDVLKLHCEQVGRDYNQIERTALGQVLTGFDSATASNLIEQCRSLAKLGIQHYIFSLEGVNEIKPLEKIGREVLPFVAEF